MDDSVADMIRKPYPSDVSDDEWALVAPDLMLLSEAAPQREHSFREVFNGLRSILKTGGDVILPHRIGSSPSFVDQAVRRCPLVGDGAESQILA